MGYGREKFEMEFGNLSEKYVAKSCDIASGWSCRESRCEERCRREFIVFQSRRGLEADFSMRLELKERLAVVMSL